MNRYGTVSYCRTAFTSTSLVAIHFSRDHAEASPWGCFLDGFSQNLPY